MALHCEALIDELRETQRQFAVDKASMRAKHLRTVDGMIQSHQTQVMHLQDQINEIVNNEEDVDETVALDLEIKELKQQIKIIEKEPLPKSGTAGETDAMIGRQAMMEEKVNELQRVLEEVSRQREEDSQNGMQMLRELMMKSQKTEDANQKEILKLVEEINTMERDHYEQAQKIKLETRNACKQLAKNLNTASAKAAQMQKEIANAQKQQKQEIKALMNVAAGLRKELELWTSRQNEHMDQATKLARKVQAERVDFAQLHKEQEVLNAEFARETLEHQNLMKELSNMDQFLLGEMTSKLGGTSSVFSFQGF